MQSSDRLGFGFQSLRTIKRHSVTGRPTHLMIQQKWWLPEAEVVHKFQAYIFSMQITPVKK